MVIGALLIVLGVVLVFPASWMLFAALDGISKISNHKPSEHSLYVYICLVLNSAILPLSCFVLAIRSFIKRKISKPLVIQILICLIFIALIIMMVMTFITNVSTGFDLAKTSELMKGGGFSLSTSYFYGIFLQIIEVLVCWHLLAMHRYGRIGAFYLCMVGLIAFLLNPKLDLSSILFLSISSMYVFYLTKKSTAALFSTWEESGHNMTGKIIALFFGIFCGVIFTRICVKAIKEGKITPGGNRSLRLTYFRDKDPEKFWFYLMFCFFIGLLLVYTCIKFFFAGH